MFEMGHIVGWLTWPTPFLSSVSIYEASRNNAAGAGHIFLGDVLERCTRLEGLLREVRAVKCCTISYAHVAKVDRSVF